MERLLAKVADLSSKTITKTFSASELNELGLENITLRPYQLDGVNWLIQRYHHGNGCILGDEMGLGKTCQTISLLVYLLDNIKSCKHLVLCPLSVLGNWKQEITRFAPNIHLEVYVGDKDARAELRNNIKNNFDVLLTTYEICLKDESFLQKFSWHSLIVDEAHRLKNRDSLLHQTLLEFDIQHRVLLTGTPIQNNLVELYSLLCFIAPSIFRWRYLDNFVERFEEVEQRKDMKELHTLLKPFLLRRIKTEVLQDLPVKTELILYHGLTALQKKYYKAILTKDSDAFDTAFGGTKTRLMNILVQLRKCVNHPYLFDGVEPEPFQLGEHLVEASGKLLLIDQLLSFLKKNGHKVLLFSQMTRMLDILQDYLGYRGYSYERLDGSVRGEERFISVKNFNERDNTFVFLLSTKAGGQGLNLTSADTVIFCDSDFNPQNDLQAAARAHRIGQTRPVKVIRLIGRSTIEEIVLKRAEAKLKLTNFVIEGGQFSLGASSLIASNNTQLQDVLKFGVDKLLEDEDSSVYDLDLLAMLGSTVDGEWQLDETTEAENIEQESDKEDIEEDNNMYVFEGEDYSKQPTADDRKAFQRIIDAEIAITEQSLAENRTTRRKNVGLLPMDVLPSVTRKPRKQLTEEEKEERKKKKAENAARRQQEEEEEEIRRAQQRRVALEKLWNKHDYKSCNLASESETESSDEDSVAKDADLGAMDTDSDDVNRSICYVSGDVTHPKNTGDKDAVIVHCVDDSGEWGYGGIFSALSARSQQPETKYELAGKMKDLALGDVHIISVDDLQSRESGRDWVSLVVAQHRDRRNGISGIKLEALRQALQKIYHFAKKNKASVHLPRIGYNTPAFNWYATERLIRKHLASKGIKTNIYYYPRKRALKRKKSDDSESSSNKKTLCSDQPSTSKCNVRSDNDQADNAVAPSTGNLPNFMNGVAIYFHDMPQNEIKKWTRYIIAYNGDVHDDIQDDTTHVIATSSQDLSEIKAYYSEKPLVSLKWLETCLQSKRQVGTKTFQILQCKFNLQAV